LGLIGAFSSKISHLVDPAARRLPFKQQTFTARETHHAATLGIQRTAVRFASIPRIG
jgi:hypothetical protein